MNIIKNILKNAIVGICIAYLHVTHIYAIDISNISNPRNYVQKFNTQTYTVGSDGTSLLYRGHDTGMRLNTPAQAESKIRVTDPTIAKRPRPPRTTPTTPTTTTTTTPTTTTTTTPTTTTTTTPTTSAAATTATTSAKPKVSTGTKVMGALGVAAGAYGIYQANAGEGERTAGDLLSATASGAIAGASIGSIFPVIGTGVGTVAGAVIGAATVGFQMFSETDCLTDPVTGKQTCCNTTTGDVIRGIGKYMFCGKDGQATTAVRQCQVGGRGKSSGGFFGFFKDLFSDDSWSKDCMPRWCNGYSAPATGLEKYILAEPDTSNVCWKWRCGDGFKLTGDKKECIINFCDGEGPDEAERDLPVYTVNLIKEKNCYEWDCIEGYEVQDRYCVQLSTEPGTGTIQESNGPLPAPVPAYDPYDDVIKKIENLIKMMEEECGTAASAEDNKVLSDYQAKQQQKQKKSQTNR